MKKLIFTLLIGGMLLGFSGSAIAQENHGEVLNVFLKFGKDPGIDVNYEIQVAKNITVSPEVFVPFEFGYFVLGARADYYFDSLLKLPAAWDIYAGVDTGIIVSGEDSFDFNVHGGVEYKFNDNWGVLGVFGGGKSTSPITAGIGVAFHIN